MSKIFTKKKKQVLRSYFFSFINSNSIKSMLKYIYVCLENDTYSPKYWIFTSIGNIGFAHGPNKDKEWVKKTVYRDAATVSKNSFLCICSI